VVGIPTKCRHRFGVLKQLNSRRFELTPREGEPLLSAGGIRSLSRLPVVGAHHVARL